MDAILTKDVSGLGEAGTVVSVSRGYMRNFLLPRGLAELATDGRVEEVRRRETQRRDSEAKAAEAAAENADILGRTVLTLKAKAGGDGRLFGSITSQDIAAAIFEAREIRVDRQKVIVEPAIRAVGTYAVSVELTPGVFAEVKTIVSPLRDDE
jgi:large subunit ribosomal protein L9